MSEVVIKNKPENSELENLAVNTWPVWIKEPSQFVKTYEMPETCYILEGEAKITPKGKEPLVISSGALLIFPSPCECSWEIIKKVKMRYLLG